MATGTGGVRTALDQAVEAAAEGRAGLGDVVQAGLFDDALTDEETGALDAPSPLSAALEPRRPRRGRPPGSKNRRTEAVVGWLLSQHRHPLAVMMEAYSMSPKDFARVALGEADPDADRLLEIVKLQLRMAEAVAPYVAQKLPQAVQLEGGASLHLSFGGVALGGADRGVSVPARGEAGEVSVGDGMSVRLGKSDG